MFKNVIVRSQQSSLVGMLDVFLCTGQGVAIYPKASEVQGLGCVCVDLKRVDLV